MESTDETVPDDEEDHYATTGNDCVNCADPSGNGDGSCEQETASTGR
jgi:hypothetical protein